MSPGPWLLATSTPTPKLVAGHLQPNTQTTTQPTDSVDAGLDAALNASCHRREGTGAVVSMSWDHRRTQLFVSFARGFRSSLEAIDGQSNTLGGDPNSTSLLRRGRSRHVVGFTRVLDWRALLSSGIAVELPVWYNPGALPVWFTPGVPLRKTAKNSQPGKRPSLQHVVTVAKAAKSGAIKYSTLVMDRTLPWFRLLLDTIFLVLVPAVQMAAVVMPPPAPLATSLFSTFKNDETYYTVDVPGAIVATTTTTPVPDSNGWVREIPTLCIELCDTPEGTGAPGKVFCADNLCAAHTKPKARVCPAVECPPPPETDLVVADAHETFELSLFRSLRLAMLATHVIPAAYLRGGAAEHALHTVTALAWAGDTSDDGLEETLEVVRVDAIRACACQ